EQRLTNELLGHSRTAVPHGQRHRAGAVALGGHRGADLDLTGSLHRLARVGEQIDHDPGDESGIDRGAHAVAAAHRHAKSLVGPLVETRLGHGLDEELTDLHVVRHDRGRLRDTGYVPHELPQVLYGALHHLHGVPLELWIGEV